MEVLQRLALRRPVLELVALTVSELVLVWMAAARLLALAAEFRTALVWHFVEVDALVLVLWLTADLVWRPYFLDRVVL